MNSCLYLIVCLIEKSGTFLTRVKLRSRPMDHSSLTSNQTFLVPWGTS